MHALHTGSVKVLRGPTHDKLRDSAIDTIRPLETAEAVSTMRHYDVKTMLQRLRYPVAVSGRSHRIPLTCQNQNRHVCAHWVDVMRFHLCAWPKRARFSLLA